MRIFRLYLTIFISAVPGQWSESRGLVWSRDTRKELYTDEISRLSSRFSDCLRCFMLMASLTLRLIFESSDVKSLVFCGSILGPVCIQCSYMAKLDLAIDVFFQSNAQRVPCFTDVIIFNLFTFYIILNTTLFQFLSFVFHVSQLLPYGVKWPMVHVDSLFLERSVQGFRCSPYVRHSYVHFLGLFIFFLTRWFLSFLRNLKHPFCCIAILP